MVPAEELKDEEKISYRVKNIVLIDQAEIEIVKFNIGGTLVDISIR